MIKKQAEYKSNIESGHSSDGNIDGKTPETAKLPPFTPYDKAIIGLIKQLKKTTKNIKPGQWYEFKIIFMFGPYETVCIKKTYTYTIEGKTGSVKTVNP